MAFWNVTVRSTYGSDAVVELRVWAQSGPRRVVHGLTTASVYCVEATSAQEARDEALTRYAATAREAGLGEPVAVRAMSTAAGPSDGQDAGR